MALAFNVASADGLHVLLLLVTVFVQVTHGGSFLMALQVMQVMQVMHVQGGGVTIFGRGEPE